MIKWLIFGVWWLVLSSCAANGTGSISAERSSFVTLEPTNPSSTNSLDSVTTLPESTMLPANESGVKEATDSYGDIGVRRFYLPKLLDSVLPDYSSGEQPIAPTGDMPTAIVASTDACDIVEIDPVTGATTILWEYSGAEYVSFYCGAHRITEDLESELPSGYEGGISFVADVEWVDSGFVLISICCEPASGRFELLAVSGGSQPAVPTLLNLEGGSPALRDGVLLFEMPVSAGSGFHTIGTTVFDAYFDTSDPDFPFYSLTGQSEFYELFFDQSDLSSGVDGFVRNVSWVDNNRLAFDLWSIGISDSEVFSWTGIIDLTQQSVSLNSHGPGWSMPSGDKVGNLVVAEQQCNYFVSVCNHDRSKILTIDSRTFTPIHELEIDGEIADMDLVRGWLLITLTNGQMGTVNFATGNFTVIADGISHAAWME